MASISIYFFDGTHRTNTTCLLHVFNVAKYAVWLYNSLPTSNSYGKSDGKEPFPKSISLEEADLVFDGLMKFHQNGQRSKKDLCHFLIDHGCHVSSLPDRWTGDGWTGEYCHYLNVEIN